MNEPLLKATLKVLTDGQAILYASIMQNVTGDVSMETYKKEIAYYKQETARLILEALDAAQGDESSGTEYSEVREQPHES